MDDSASKQASQVSLQDRLRIASEISTVSNVDPIELVKPKVIVKERRSKVLQKILTPTPLSKPYFTAGKRINDENQKDLQKEPSPFTYPENMEIFAHNVMTKAWRDDVRVKELKLKCFQRPSYKARQKRDLLNRLYVKEPTTSTMKVMKDIDPQYFSIIEGDYIELVRESLRTRIITGYREDDIMLIEENLKLEQTMIDTIKENYQTYVNTFEEFLYKDHTSAMALLKQSEEAAMKAYDMYEEYKSIAKKYGALRSSLFNLEEKWRNCKTYQKFLYTVSPLSWRMQQKAYRRASVFMMEEDPDDDENIFGRYRASLSEKGVSLTDILKQFREELMDEQPPQLYFTAPEELMDVFRFMEMQNLNSLLHSEELAIPLDNVREGMKKAEELFDKEIKNLQEIIDKLEGGIKWEEQRVCYLEEVALKLIDGEFKALVKDDEVPSDQVAQLEVTFYAEQVMVMRLAEKAAKQYAELERLTNNLKKRSPPLKPPKKVQLPPRCLTQAEQEYLEFFTDFCKYSDDPGAYGIDTQPHEEEMQGRGEIDEHGDEAKQEEGRKLLTIASEILNAQSLIKKH
ncbi:hypothetical protein NQ314_008679 [Rhamnusium bicolor]|uniref:DUF4200 domain-containing protein n=1 Tax=Rhamnusium bicolor TaxID=1586634 RepID=A0AAV8Y7N1_9CUCU|nr:hypothetical protein NQ314_008679 [Rhamnusium bicolor]